jgi:glycosyltransferase involved in cell wall biosynthesis
VRVCVLVHNDVSADGRVIRQADALAAGGHDVTVVGVCNPGSGGDQAWTQSHDWELKLYHRERTDLRSSYNWFASALRSRMAVHASRAVDEPGLAAHALVRALPEVADIARSCGPELVVANDLTTLPIAARVGETLDVPLIYDAHDLYTDEDAERPPHWQPIIERVERSFIGRAAAVLTASSGYAEILERLYGVQPVVIYNVPPLEWSRADEIALPEPGSDRPLRLLHQGFLGFGSRGLEDLVAAFPDLAPGTELHVRGFVHPEAAAAIDALAGDYPGRVHVHPVVSPRDLLLEGRNCDIGLLMTSPTSRSNVLSVPNKLFEYCHSGLAVVATALPGPAAILAETGAGVTYEPGDAAGLRDCINRFAEDRAALRECRRRAVHAAARYNWEAEQLKVRDVVERVLAGERPAVGGSPTARVCAAEQRAAVAAVDEMSV